MAELLNDVRKEVEDIHEFFVAWFNGTADPSQLDMDFVARMAADMTFVSPDGVTLSRDQLVGGFQQAHGNNPDFRIQIRDVAIRQVLDQHILVTYTEWQRGSARSSSMQNARQSSALLTKGRPFKWLYIQETWLPEDVRAADSFDF